MHGKCHLISSLLPVYILGYTKEHHFISIAFCELRKNTCTMHKNLNYTLVLLEILLFLSTYRYKQKVLLNCTSRMLKFTLKFNKTQILCFLICAYTVLYQNLESLLMQKRTSDHLSVNVSN